MEGGGDIAAACTAPGVAASDSGKWGVRGGAFVVEVEDEAADNGKGFGNGVTCVSMPHDLVSDHFLLFFT